MSSENKIDASASDKRYLPRWQVKNRVTYRFNGDIAHHEARTRDLSCAGASILSPFPITQKLKMKIYLFEDDSVEVEGQPVWAEETRDGHLTGINFLNTSTDIQNKILQYAFEIKKDDVVKHWFEGWKK